VKKYAEEVLEVMEARLLAAQGYASVDRYKFQVAS
jgi:hypothetical protein